MNKVLEDWESKSPEQVAQAEADKKKAANQAMKELAEEFLRLTEAHSQTEKMLEDCKGRIASALSPGDDEEVVWMEDGFMVSVTRKPNMRWDSEKLEAMFAGAALPDHIKRRLSVAKDAYEKMDDTERTKLAHALTIEDGAPRVRVKRKTA